MMTAALARGQDFFAASSTKGTGKTLQLQSSGSGRPGTGVAYAPSRPTNAAPRSESVMLSAPLSLSVPTFASDFTAAVMTQEMAAQMDERYLKVMRTFVTASGMEMVERDPLARDRGANRPMMLSLSHEMQLRRDMANSLKSYMLARGLPRFLGSREQTKALAQTVQEVQNATRLEVKTKSQWLLGAGVNPFESKAWGNYRNERWKFEVMHEYGKNLLRTSVVRQFSNFAVETNYFIFQKVLQPNLIYVFKPLLIGRLIVDVPVTADNVARATVTTARLEHWF
jgi:hypothetical protein